MNIAKKTCMLYTRNGVYLRKKGEVVPQEFGDIRKNMQDAIILSTFSSFLVFPGLISLKSNEVFGFEIEVNKIDPRFWPQGS